MPRLSLASLAALGDPAGVTRTAVDPRELTVGQVHLGLGAFHRAHQEVYTEDAIAATGDTGWGVLGVTQRSPLVAEQLAPQDGLYGVLTLGGPEPSLRIVGSLRGVAFPGVDTARVVAAIAAPTTHVVTLTVTEKGYRRAPGGGLDVTEADTAADLAALRDALSGPDGGSPSRTPVGLLLRGLAARARADAGPLSVVCCDNLSDNGAALRALVRSWIVAAGTPWLSGWLDDQVRFPGTMVDRIVPATTAANRRQAAAMLGLSDEGLVVGEPFTQWVIEDDFAGPRPAWHRAGATLAHDVAPYERAKLRVLNGAHSTLAYLGALRGHATIAQAIADPELEGIVRALIDRDVLPTLVAPPGLDLGAYRDQVLGRFANHHTGHTTVQVAMDGSQKLPQRLLDTARDRIAAGAVPVAVATSVAAWIAYVRAAASGTLVVADRTVTLDDPMGATLAEAASGPLERAVDRVFAVRTVFGDDLPQATGFRDAVLSALRVLAPPRTTGT